MAEEATKVTPAEEVLVDLDGGVFMQKVTKAMADVAEGVVHNSRQGTVTITLDMKQIENSQQIAVKHTVKYTKPTMRGKVTEEDASATPLYVGVRGRLSFMPDNQHTFGFMGKDKTRSQE